MSAGSTSDLLEFALSGSEVGLRQLIDAIPHMTWLASAEKGNEFVSRHWEGYTGMSPADLVGYGWVATVHPDDSQRVVDDWRRSLVSGEEFQHTVRFRRRDGEFRWFTNRGVPLRNKQGVIVKWFGTTTDVHEEYATRDALLQNEERLRYVELATHDSIYDWNLSTGVARRNEAFQTHFGAPPSENVENGWWMQNIHPDDRVPVTGSGTEAFRARRPTWEGEYRLRRRDGVYANVVDRGYLIYDDEGKPLRMIGAILDITERKQVEQSLRDAQARLLSAIEAGKMATWIWDVKSDVLQWDEAAYRLWGRTKEEVGQLTVKRTFDFMIPEYGDRMRASIDYFRRTGVEGVVEYRTQRHDGALQWLQARGRVERDASGAPIRMSGVYIDVTDRKRTEEAQLRSQKMEALGTLAGGIAHDFNNILLAISGNAKLALEDAVTLLPQNQALKKSLTEIEKASARAADLVRRILTFSRQQEAHRETLQLQPLVEEALRLLRPTLPANVEIRTAFAPDAPAVLTDAIQVHQVVMNLMTNAAHAIGDRAGSIEIGLQRVNIDAASARAREDVREGLHTCLSVRDSGSGIDPQIVDRIFDPFFTTKQAGQGTGLGLAVVHGIVKAHGGAIEVGGKLGEGAVFRVLFPASTGEQAPQNIVPTPPVQGSGEHILYVDDEEPLVFLIARILERLGYRVTGCVDPQQALNELTAQPQAFDALVTDLSMRGMNGFELARAVRKIRDDLPILLTSGYLRNEDRETAQQCGIRELILKPNTVEELGQAIDRELHALRKD